jgi:hypothetical protein
MKMKTSIERMEERIKEVFRFYSNPNYVLTCLLHDGHDEKAAMEAIVRYLERV